MPMEKKVKPLKLWCPYTQKKEDQEILKESEDGVTLKCKGCERIHSHEIGELT